MSSVQILCCYYHFTSFMTDLYLFAVEDKVKDQLEAANPEPIIEEVVMLSENMISFVVVSVIALFTCFLLCQDLANLAPRKPDW